MPSPTLEGWPDYSKALSLDDTERMKDTENRTQNWEMDRKDHLCCASAAYHKAEKQRVQLLCCATVIIIQNKRQKKWTNTELGDGLRPSLLWNSHNTTKQRAGKM
jgi:hypothetical protein